MDSVRGAGTRSGLVPGFSLATGAAESAVPDAGAQDVRDRLADRAEGLGWGWSSRLPEAAAGIQKD